MKRLLDNDWQEQLQESFEQPYYQQLRAFLKQEYAQQKIHPAMDHIYEALKLTPYHDVKVVILGQDPYHGPGLHLCPMAILCHGRSKGSYC